jgi:antitoxin FitA
MVAIQIRDVPKGTRDELAARARENGQSLQSFLLDVLIREATASHHRRLLAAWARSPLVQGSEQFDTSAYIRQMREEREQELVRRADHG